MATATGSLAERRAVGFHGSMPHAAISPLSIELILALADEHQQRTGQWPRVGSGPVIGRPGDTWLAINAALQQGDRGLPGGSSLPAILREHRGVNRGLTFAAARATR